MGRAAAPDNNVAAHDTDGGPANAASEIIFRGADEGDGQLPRAIARQGRSRAGVRRSSRSRSSPRSCWASTPCSPPMLEILNSDNFITSYAGATSQGKTITLRIAASCWGCPNEKSTTSAMALGRDSGVVRACTPGAQSLAAGGGRHQACQQERDHRPDDLRRGFGRRRGRGSIQGLARNDAFRTVMVTSGEAPITSFSEDGGTGPSLEVWGSPFGQADAATAQIVNRVNDGVQDHYGQLGPRFVEYLIENRDAGPTGENSIANFGSSSRIVPATIPWLRMATHLAAISMTAGSSMRPSRCPGSIAMSSASCGGSRPQRPRSRPRPVGLRHVLSWAHGTAEQFLKAYGSGGSTPPVRWLGRSLGSLTARTSLTSCSLPHRLKDVLEAGGFEPEPIKRLAARSEMAEGLERQDSVPCASGHPPLMYLVAIRREAIEQVEGPVEEEERRCPPATLKCAHGYCAGVPKEAPAVRRIAAADKDDKSDRGPPEAATATITPSRSQLRSRAA